VGRSPVAMAIDLVPRRVVVESQLCAHCMLCSNLGYRVSSIPARCSLLSTQGGRPEARDDVSCVTVACECAVLFVVARVAPPGAGGVGLSS